jgi:hypothetical protein
MGLFHRKSAQERKADEQSAKREAIRRRWEAHMGRMPPSTSNGRELVDLRARLAEYDVKASRYVGAVLMGHAEGAEAPLEGMADLALRMSALIDTRPNEKAELRFHLHEFTETSAVVTEAMKLQRGVP